MNYCYYQSDIFYFYFLQCLYICYILDICKNLGPASSGTVQVLNPKQYRYDTRVLLLIYIRLDIKMTIAYTYMHTHWTGLGIYFFLFHSFLNFFAHLTIWLIYELVSCYLLGYFFSNNTILALTCPATCAVLSVALSLV